MSSAAPVHVFPVHASFPTLLEMESLEVGGAIYHNNIIHVAASIVEPTGPRVECNFLVAFNCPCCWSRYKKDGSPTTNATHPEHTYPTKSCDVGSVYKAEPHCNRTKSNPPGVFCVWVTAKTVQGGKKKARSTKSKGSSKSNRSLLKKKSSKKLVEDAEDSTQCTVPMNNTKI